MRFDFDSETCRRLGYRLIDQINAFFSSLPDRAVQVPVEQRGYGQLDRPLPGFAEDAGRVLDEVCREMMDKGFHVPSANYFGLMNPTAPLHRSAGRGPGGGAQSATGDFGTFATGLAD
jgi:hypothetical protein